MRYGLVAAVWFYGLTNYLDRVALSFAGPSVMKSLAIGPAEFGLILSSFSLGYTLAQVPGGLLADRWNAKIIMIIAPLFWAFFSAATGFITSPIEFMAVRICLGLSEGIALGAVFKVQFDNFSSRERPVVAAIGLTTVAVAPVIAGPLVGYLITAFGWQAAFFALVLPSVAVAAVNYFLIPARGSIVLRREPETTLATSSRLGSLAGILRLRSFWFIAGAWFCFNFAYWGYNGWMPSYLALERQLDIKSVGALGAMPFVLGFFGLVLAGWLGADRLYRYRPQLLSATYVGAGASLYFAYSSQMLISSIVGLSFSAFFLFGGIGVIYALAADLSPDRSRGTYWGAVSTVGQLAGVIAPAVIGKLVALTHSFAAGFGFMIFALLIAAILILLVIPSMAAATGRDAKPFTGSKLISIAALHSSSSVNK